MALTPSGTISMSDVNTALGRSATAAISFNDDGVRFLANQDSGAVTMNAMRNKYYFTGTVRSGTWTDKGYSYYGTDLYNAPPPTYYATGGILNYGGLDFMYGGTDPVTIMGVVGGTYTDVGPARLQVGSGPKVTMNWSGNSYYSSTQGMFSSDVNVVRSWRWASTN